MLFSFCFTFNLLIIKKKKKKCAEDSVEVLGHHKREPTIINLHATGNRDMT